MPYLKRTGETLPTFIAADHIAGKNDVEVVADGNVELRKRNSILLSDRLTYWQLRMRWKPKATCASPAMATACMARRCA
jgi:lipopolysaccharide assembly outer membrane protein LptD (OstA)